MQKKMMKKSRHQSSKEIIPAINIADQQHSKVESSKKGRPRKPTYVKYFHNYPYSHQKNHYDSRNELSHYKEYSQSYVQRQNTVEYVPTQHLAALQERLRNIHDHYRKLIDEEKSKNEEKGEVIMGLIEEMQMTHGQKMEGIRKMLEESEMEKKEVGLVDQKMIEIKGNIDDLIEQSNHLKIKNSELEKRIAEKVKSNEQKEDELEELNSEVLESRTQLQQFQITNLKQNKINREILDIFNTVDSLSQ